MNFLKRHQYALMILAVVILSCILITYQYLANDSAHVQVREDFILLATSGNVKQAEHLYQELILHLKDLPDQSLIADFQRLAVLDLREKQEPGSLAAKYMAAVQNTLEKRAADRVSKLLKSQDR